MQSDIQTISTVMNAAGAKTGGVHVIGAFLVLVKGTFSGSLSLERRIAGSTDESDFLPVAIDTSGAAVTLTQPGAYAFDEPAVNGAEYRLVATTLASGTATVSFDQ